ncbi:MAG: adenylate/guanylate cyclase domain-containing protein [Elusimicrobia bacterium]|nr:adenylate/guanylate cyclase domain-containing protein [Elusimicrobiota bacterium]
MLSFYSAAAKWLTRRTNAIYRWAHVIVPLALLIGAVAIRSRQGGLDDEIKNRVFDRFQKIRPRQYEQVPVRIVDLDDESLAKLGQWPWPRTLLARFVERMSAQGASVIAFDAVFAEPDRTSPSQVASLWPDTPQTRELKGRVKELPDHDLLFASAIAKANVVTGFALIGEKNAVVPLANARFAYAGDGPLSYLPDFPGAVADLPVLEKAAAGNGSIGFIPEPDGIVRRAPLLFRRGQTLLPSLAAEALRAAQGVPQYAIKASGASGETSFGAHTGITKVKIGQFVLPTDETGRVWVYYTKEAPERTVPAWCVFDKKCAGDKLKGAIVFVGTSAAGLKDLRATPLNPGAPGVEVHANLAEQALLGVYLHRPDWADGAEILYMVVLGLLLLFLLPRVNAGLCAVVAAGGIFGAFGFSWHMFTVRHYLFDPVFPSVTVLLIYMSSSLISHLRSEAERKQVRSAFGQYLHPKLVAELAKHPEKLQLGGVIREMTVLFCDIRGFTTISEQYDAHGLTQVINRFLTPMSGIIMERMGTIDKYIGDCIMAFWNAPEEDKEHAVNACRSALEMHRRLDILNADWENEDKAQNRKFIPIHIGVGLNTGPCLVGNMGSDQKFNYSVLGDDVNLASRLEGQSKTYGAQTVIGPGTRELAPEFAAIELDCIRVKGKTRPVNIFGLMGDAEIAASPEFKELAARHAEMLKVYRAKDWDAAEKLIEQCRKAPYNLKVLYDLYGARIKAYRDHAPAADWDGTFTATTK